MAEQQHLDRLSAIDAGFLAQEKPNTHMHIGGLALFEGEPPGLDAFLAHIESRLHLVPRYRQKLATPPLETGRPLWIDDPNLNLAYHVRNTALPPPGGEDGLLHLCARICSQRLDRSRPLWELWLVEGLDERARARGRHGHRRGRVDRAQPPARHRVQRAAGPAPPDQDRPRGARRVQARQGRVRHHRQRRRARGGDRRARLLPAVARAPHGRARAQGRHPGLGPLGGAAGRARQPAHPADGAAAVFLDDPIARLRYVKEAMDGLKESRQLLAASAIASLQGFAPPTLHAQALRQRRLDALRDDVEARGAREERRRARLDSSR